MRVLTIVDICTKLCPAMGEVHAYKGHDVVATLEAAAREHGRPKHIRVDNGPEFVSRDLELWPWQHGVVLDYSRPGKPTDNAFAESSNSRVRQECLNRILVLEPRGCGARSKRGGSNTKLFARTARFGHVPPAEHAQLLFRPASSAGIGLAEAASGASVR
jgi:putative transposase